MAATYDDSGSVSGAAARARPTTVSAGRSAAIVACQILAVISTLGAGLATLGWQPAYLDLGMGRDPVVRTFARLFDASQPDLIRIPGA
jgi:hypothetical protein